MEFTASSSSSATLRASFWQSIVRSYFVQELLTLFVLNFQQFFVAIIIMTEKEFNGNL